MGGMCSEHLRFHIEHLLRMNGPPDYLVIHCGGNDIGRENMVHTINEIKKLISSFIIPEMPNTRIVWSQILPRRSWRYIPLNQIANKTRARIYSCLSTFFIKKVVHILNIMTLQKTKHFLLMMTLICLCWVVISC